jgi:tripartite-type tricarboxylate transporter receptor subunit TctC
MRQKAMKRGIIALALVLALGGAVTAQSYPTKPIKLIVPFAPGGPADVIGRIIGQQAGIILGQSFVVENRGGAGGTIGARLAAQAEPDGYTLMFANTSTLSINPAVYKNLDFDPAKAFVPVALVGTTSNIVVVNPALPVKSIADLIAYGKANPGKLTYASQGAGSTAHLSGSELELLGGIKMVHVPYNGAQPALTDVMSGNVDMFFDTLTTSVPLYRAGKLKLLGVASEERSKDVPEIPTIAESGLPGFRSITWFPIVGPPGMPQALADKINADVVAVLQKPQIDDKLRALRLEPMGGTPADAAKFFASETKLWGRVIKEANITLQ